MALFTQTLQPPQQVLRPLSKGAPPRFTHTHAVPAVGVSGIPYSRNSLTSRIKQAAG